jgi:hypothetical protein
MLSISSSIISSSYVFMVISREIEYCEMKESGLTHRSQMAALAGINEGME